MGDFQNELLGDLRDNGGSRSGPRVGQLARLTRENHPEMRSSQEPVYGLRFYRGLKEIAEFLKLHPRTVQRLIQEKKIPVKQDESGRYVLSDWDYFRSLESLPPKEASDEKS